MGAKHQAYLAAAVLCAAALLAALCLTAQVPLPDAKRTVDWSDDGRTLTELADEAKAKGISTVIVNRKYFDQKIEFPPMDTLAAVLPVHWVHLLLVRDMENVTEPDERDFDIRTWIKFSVVENLTGKRLDNEDAHTTPAAMSPPNAGEIVYGEQGGSLSVKGVTFIHSKPILNDFRRNQLYLALLYVSVGGASFPLEPPPLFLVSEKGTLRPLIADLPLARNVKLVAENSLDGVRQFIEQHRSEIPSY